MSDLVNTISSIAEKLGPMLVPGAGAAIAIGQDLLKLIDSTKAVVSEQDGAKLDSIRDELEPKVMKHADDTEARLRG
jgi:hypothetical protein